MKKIETEIKYQLTERDFNKFAEYCNENYKKVDSVLQENHYLDTKQLYFDNVNVSMRIRKYIGKDYELTIKKPMESFYENLHIKDEYTVKICNQDAEEIIKANHIEKESCIYSLIVNAVPKWVYSEKLFVIGKLKTARENYKCTNIDGIISLDTSNYFDKTDFEVEWETEAIYKAQDELRNIFKKLSIIPIADTFSKRSRFIRAYKEQKARINSNMCTENV